MGGNKGNRMEIVEAVNVEEIEESICMLRAILAAELR